MRSELGIRRKLKKQQKYADDALKRHLEAQKIDSRDESHLRIYNKYCERIWTLQWALGEAKEI
jgi:hypothetical protein